MRGMTIDTDGGVRIAVHGAFLAMDRREVCLRYGLVALCTYLRDLQPGRRTDLTVDVIYIVSVMTVVTGRIGPRLVFPVGPCVDRPHITFDLLHDLAQPCQFFSAAFFLSDLPQILVTLHASDPPVHALAVRDLRDVFVALHARPTAMHARFEVFRRHIQLARVTVGQGRTKRFDPVAGKAGCIGRGIFLRHRRSCRQTLQRRQNQ